MLGAPCRFLFPAALGRYGFVEQQVLLELEGDALVNGHVFLFEISPSLSTFPLHLAMFPAAVAKSME